MTRLNPIVYTLDAHEDDENRRTIQQLGESLMHGALVVFPTETVYGLGANALNRDAVLRIFEAKKRPLYNPVICHVASVQEAFQLFSAEEHPLVLLTLKLFAEHFWPGPLSLVAKASSIVPREIMGGGQYVSVRYPDHPVAQQLIQAAKVPIAAPSANLFGHISPSLAIHVSTDLAQVELQCNENLRDQHDLYILDSGACQVGIESTVCKVAFNTEKHCLKVTILRRGFVSAEMLNDVVLHYLRESKESLNREWYDLLKSCNIEVKKELNELCPSRNQDTASLHSTLSVVLESPGNLLTHYAPTFPTFLLLRSKNVPCQCQIEIQQDEKKITKNLNECILIDSFGIFQDMSSSVAKYFELCTGDESIEDIPKKMQRSVFKVLHNAETYATQLSKDDKTSEDVFICIADFYDQARHFGEGVMAVYDRIFR